MKIFLDTNFWIRLFLEDNPQQLIICKNLISQIESGEFQPYTSSIVFLEISYVLKSVYNIPFSKIIEILGTILTLRGITVNDKTNTKKAFKFYKKYKIKFTDCLIASQLKEDMVLVSFDKELAKIKEIVVKKPQQVLSVQQI